MENLKKGDRIAINNREAFIVSRNIEKRVYYIVDFFNNIDSVSFDENIKKIKIKEEDLSDLIYCLSGLEDNRFSHWDKNSFEEAVKMDVDPKFLNLKNKLKNIVGDKKPHTITVRDKEIQMFFGADYESPIVVPHNIVLK